MSEVPPDNSLEPSFQVIVDPSAENLPSTMVSAYADMNENIARDRVLFGSTLQIGHLAASQRDIAETAQEALRRTHKEDERTAIILGAGGCLDIPLEQIVTDFRKATVVDVHTEQTERALSELPSKLLGKVSLVQAELSGLAKSVNNILEQAGEERDYGQFLRVATAMARQMNIAEAQVNFGNEYTFACSQLLLTQLSSIPLMHFSRFVGEKYGKPLTMARGNEDESLVLALNAQSVKLQTSHIKQLNGLVRSTGTVHFADTVGEMRGGQMLPMVSHDVITTIGSNFSELREMNIWYYTVSPRQRFVVGSYSLAPKQAM